MKKLLLTSLVASTAICAAQAQTSTITSATQWYTDGGVPYTSNTTSTTNSYGNDTLTPTRSNIPHGYTTQCYSDSNRASLVIATPQADGRYIGSAHPGASTWVVEIDASGSVISKLNCWDFPGAKANWDKYSGSDKFSANPLCAQYANLEERQAGLGVYLAGCTTPVAF